LEHAFYLQQKTPPEEVLLIIDKPVIRLVVEEAISAGVEDVIIVTGKGKRSSKTLLMIPSN